MNPFPLTPKAQELLTACIDSVAQLDVLLLLNRNRSRVWTLAELAAELRGAESGTRPMVQQLVDHRLLEWRGTGVAFAGTGEAAEAVGELARAYQLSPVAVVSFIYNKPSRTLKSFADAFRLRPPGGPKEGGPNG